MTACTQLAPTCISRVADQSPPMGCDAAWVPAAEPHATPPALVAALLPRAASLLPDALKLVGICESILVRLPVKVRTS